MTAIFHINWSNVQQFAKKLWRASKTLVRIPFLLSEKYLVKSTSKILALDLPTHNHFFLEHTKSISDFTSKNITQIASTIPFEMIWQIKHKLANTTQKQKFVVFAKNSKIFATLAILWVFIFCKKKLSVYFGNYFLLWVIFHSFYGRLLKKLYSHLFTPNRSCSRYHPTSHMGAAPRKTNLTANNYHR